MSTHDTTIEWMAPFVEGRRKAADLQNCRAMPGANAGATT